MKRLLLGVLLASLPAAQAAAESSPSSPGRLFEIGAGARPLALGGAYSAEGRDVTALYYNPAGLGMLDGRQVQVMHAALFGGAAYDYLGYAQNFSHRPGGWGAQVLRLGVSGGEGRDETNAPSGSFGYSEMALGLGFGLRSVLLPELSLGGGFKYLSRSLGGSSDKMMGVDAGAQYGPFLADRLNFGLAVHDAFSRASGNTSDVLPMSVRAGASYRVLAPVLLALEVSDSRELRAGLEYDFGMTALRAGYAPDGMTFGGGLKLRKSLSVDLAVVNGPLGMTQRLSLGWKFGANKPQKLVILAKEYLDNGIAELAGRDYFGAGRDLDKAFGLDSKAGGAGWKQKAARLRALLTGMEAREASDMDGLSSNSPAALLAQKAVSKFLAGDDSEAVLLAHVAAGTADRAPAYMALLKSMAATARQQVRREDLLSAGLFVSGRVQRGMEAFRARRYDASIQDISDAALVQPDDAEIWMKLGSARFAAGDKVRALEAYRKSLELEPGNTKLRSFLRENFGS